MSQKRLTTWQKATALVPLALLSGAWTASLAGTTTATAATKHVSLPDGTPLPDKAIEAPASLSRPGEIAPGVPAGAAQSVIASASTNGIPAAAMAAYQRAAEVIDSADPSCHLGWQLVAAIGRVESDHGRYGGNVLDDDGRSTPGIFGIPLDGRDGTARITDTDAGQYDEDPVYDRAVGPMQFIPSTWSVVGVDADGDDVRDPQDIDDAALATAVYLCSGKEDLSTSAGQRAAVYRYNHSQDYVDLVLSIMNAYIDGQFASVPNGTAAPTVFTPTSSNPSARPAHHKKADGPKHGSKSSAGSTGPGGSSGTSGGSGGGDGARPSSGGNGGTTNPGGPSVPGTPAPDPVKDTTDKVKGTVDETSDTVKSTVDPVVEATNYCQGQLAGKGADAAQVQQCVDAFLSGGKSAADAAIADLLDVLGDLGGGLLGGG